MEFLFVVYILMNDIWVRGDEIEGWASYPYATEAQCLAAVERAEALQKELKRANPRAYDKRFECERVEVDGSGDEAGEAQTQ